MSDNTANNSTRSGTGETQRPASPSQSQYSIKYLIKALVKYNASDLHLKVGRPPLFRINGKLIPAKMPELSEQTAQSLIYSLLSAKQMVQLEEYRQCDLSFSLKEYGRFRCNVYYQKGTLSAAIRMIPLLVPQLEELGVPLVLKEMVARPRGLFLITGATGAGKSTTMAALIQHINETSNVHVLALEDPIEFVYKDFKATITQRELGSDIHSMAEGLQAGLRQDPDVIVLGELRDCEMIKTALTAAETGHLVMATMHTNDCRQTIDRILDVFPGEEQNQIRVQLSSALIGVVSQQLLLRADGTGRVPACEIMVKSPTIENHILKGKLELIQEAISNSSDYYKMQSMNQSLEKLVRSGVVTSEEALKSSNAPDDLRLALAGLSRDDGYQIKAG